ncbi:hypothetical protein C6503_01250 [Candidatus Poribacteria bacterium]|nr:MAG: hypothetical protein C6503_01250 [Candidatus Poribacteria bacterium]
MRLKMIFSLIFSVLMCVGVCQVFAEAPTTPKILFTSTRDGNDEVYMMNPDGSEQVNLTQHPTEDFEAAWSPTGEQILFVSDRGGVRDLYVMDADGSNVRRVFKRKIKATKRGPTWSPDGKRFAYVHRDWDRRKFSLHLGRFGEEDVESLPYVGSPAWSPDGSEIVGNVSHALGSRLTFINLDTRDREQPLPDKTLPWQYLPSWSAAGDRLAITGNKHPRPAILDRDLHEAWNDKFTVYLVNRDGTGLRQLVEEAGPDIGVAALSPDGSEVLYAQEINGNEQLFKLDINTGVRTQLTHIGGPFHQANFQGDWFDPAYALPVSPQPDLLTTTWGQLKKE